MSESIFSPALSTLNRWVLPDSRIEERAGIWRFVNGVLSGMRPPYTDSQVDDYQGLRRHQYQWQPPLRMRVRARFSGSAGSLHGTAGFGFWNDPFKMTGGGTFALPRAIWFFFASRDSNMKLDLNIPGHGWKAATIDVNRLPFYLLAPTAPLAIPLMTIRPLYRSLWPIGQRAIGVSEAALSLEMTDWHSYSLNWGVDRAVFQVDGETVLDCDTPPKGPLGFVMWIDNQAMTITPWGRVGWRTLSLEREQWMEVAELEISSV